MALLHARVLKAIGLSENAVATQQRLRRRRLNALPQFPAGSEERKETVSKSVALLHARVLKAIGLSENAVATQQRLRRRRFRCAALRRVAPPCPTPTFPLVLQMVTKFDFQTVTLAAATSMFYKGLLKMFTGPC